MLYDWSYPGINGGQGWIRTTEDGNSQVLQTCAIDDYATCPKLGAARGIRSLTRRGLNPLPFALEGMVGVAGFEPAAPWSQTRCATKLRYTPNLRPWPPISLHHGDEYQCREATAASSCTGMPQEAGTRGDGGTPVQLEKTKY